MLTILNDLCALNFSFGDDTNHDLFFCARTIIFIKLVADSHVQQKVLQVVFCTLEFWSLTFADNYAENHSHVNFSLKFKCIASMFYVILDTFHIQLKSFTHSFTHK